MKSKILIMLALAGLSSCSKQLDKIPDNRAIITTPAQVSMLLTAAYPHATYMLFTEAMSDNVEDKGNSAAGISPLAYQLNQTSFQYKDPVTEDGPDLPITYWQACYHAIAVANTALSFCHGPDSVSYQAQKGEALLCRAYAHFMLTVLFTKTYDPLTAVADPGVPYLMDVSNQVFRTFDRGTVAGDYAAIEKDLLEGLPLIDESSYGSVPKFHFNLQAANAFASRFYLFRQDYDKCLKYAKAVFGSKDPVQIIRDEETIFATMQYSEIAQEYTSSGENSNLLLQEVNSEYPANYASLRFGLGNDKHNAFFSGNATGGQYATTIYGASPQFFNIPKFYTNVVPLLSAEEVLFNKAEAELKLGDNASAIADLNTWASRNIANYDPVANLLTQDILASYYGQPAVNAIFQCIMDFKRIAYLQEGLRWLDLLRLHTNITHSVTGSSTILLSADDPRRLLQLPAEAVGEGMPLNPR